MEYRKATPIPREVVNAIKAQREQKAKQGKPLHREAVVAMQQDMLRAARYRVPIIDNRFELQPQSGREYHDWLGDFGDNYRTNEQQQIDPDWHMLELLMIKSLGLADVPSWYRISNDLLAQLRYTDIGRVHIDDLHLPYPVTFIELPSGSYSDETGTTCLAISVDEVDYTGEVIYATMLGKDRSSWMYYIADESTGLFTPRAGDSEAERDGRPIDGYVCGEHLSGMDYIKAMYNIVIGALLHINPKDPKDVKPPTTKKRKPKGKQSAKERAKDLLNANTWLVGSELKLDPELRQAMTSTPEQRKFTQTILVPGHYQHYWCGPKGNQYRRYTKKEPYIKQGKGPILGHSYA